MQRENSHCTLRETWPAYTKAFFFQKHPTVRNLILDIHNNPLSLIREFCPMALFLNPVRLLSSRDLLFLTYLIT